MCTSAGLDCQHASAVPSCPLACQGLYADVAFSSPSETLKDQDRLGLLNEEYGKTQWTSNIQFSPGAGAQNNYSKSHQINWHMPLLTLFSYAKQAGTSSSPHLRWYRNLWQGDNIKILYSNFSICEVERDVKMTVEGLIGLIGGTMGLFTGFSILSGVEIVYYIVKYFLARLNYRMNQEGRKSSI